jgi:hypothetical protein
MNCDRCSGAMREERVQRELVEITNVTTWHCETCGRIEYRLSSVLESEPFSFLLPQQLPVFPLDRGVSVHRRNQHGNLRPQALTRCAFLPAHSPPLTVWISSGIANCSFRFVSLIRLPGLARGLSRIAAKNCGSRTLRSLKDCRERKPRDMD